ncbi:DUF4269 domain-containing protein [Thalassospira sp. CH_XMU1448-2]|uniref:DUF4269 domain-containing protein n=1 Tax=Thalassospira sp. CH_XMU1448-2 TaxID=3107773 RepID=UPI00300A4177
MNWPDQLCIDHFRGLDGLEQASSRGLSAAGILRDYRILETLAEFDPVIAGTLPISIDTAQSDIDILCHASDLTAFEQFALRAFGAMSGFTCYERQATRNVRPALVVRFTCDDLPVEIFATDCPATLQYGFVHMLVEARILHLMGDGFADDVRALKETGVKTEPAFAKLLEIDGDPYIALANLVELNPVELATYLSAKPR